MTTRAQVAEDDVKNAREELQQRSQQVEDLQARIETLNQQVLDFQKWHQLLLDDAQRVSAGADDQPQEQTVVVNREKHNQLKKNFLLLTERVMKSDKRYSQLLEKLKDRDSQVKELQMKSMDNSVVPRAYESLRSGEDTEQLEDVTIETAVKERDNLRAIVSEKENLVASLQTQLSSFEQTAAKHSQMEKHGKEQSKAVMEWRKKYESAEVSGVAVYRNALSDSP